MTSVRRRVLRPPAEPAVDAAQTRCRERWRHQLAADWQAFRRWMTKLRRAFTTIDRLQASNRRRGTWPPRGSEAR